MTTSIREVISYTDGIRAAFRYLLTNYREVFAMGQGLWSPWYVGTTMTDLDKEFGRDRIIDTPVSESACTGAALGAALCGYRPIVIHPRVDFMLLAIDQIVSQAAKWRAMFGGQTKAPVTIRAIVNRGGEQGAQHSQSLHSWFAHVPGLRVVVPATAEDARDLLVASVLSDDPVLYIDDRWLYESESLCGPIEEVSLAAQGPRILRAGTDITLVGLSHTTRLCMEAAENLERAGISAEVIDLRILNPLKADLVSESVSRTGNLYVADPNWASCGIASEVMAQVTEQVEPRCFRSRPRRITLPAAPAPTSAALEKIFYFTAADIEADVRSQLGVSPVSYDAQTRS